MHIIQGNIMTIEEILNGLAHTDNKFPREAMQQAIAQQEEIIPHLLKILETAAGNPNEALDQHNFSYLYAMFLLAQFRERRAYPLIVKLASLPAKTADEMLGDTITDDLSSILASVCHGDTSLITELIENRDAEQYARGAAIESLVILVARGVKSRDEVMAYFKSLFEGRLEREPSYVWGELVVCATDLYPEEIHEQIEKAFENDLVDEWIIDLDLVNQGLSLGKETALAKLRDKAKFLDDAIAEMEWWAWYKDPNEAAASTTKNRKQTKQLPTNWTPPVPYVAAAKVGRNEPCSCGSGKKFKKCCGA